MPFGLDRTAAGVVVALLTIAACGAGADASVQAKQEQTGNPDAKIVADFEARLKQYAALHDKLESTLPDLPDKAEPEQIDAHQRQLERLIARARAGAERGDILTEPTRAYIRRQLSRVFNGPEGRDVRGVIMDEETRAVRLRINARYPDGVPRSNVPPQVLLVLPRLPEQLEYRFVGERLILLDIHALMVLDYMDSAVPR